MESLAELCQPFILNSSQAFIRVIKKNNKNSYPNKKKRFKWEQAEKKINKFAYFIKQILKM